MSSNFSIVNFHNGCEYFAYNFFGCHRFSQSEFIFRLWCPNVKSVSVIGSFNNWNENINIMRQNSMGEYYEAVIKANVGDIYKFCIQTLDNRKLYKVDPYAFASDIPNSFSSKICEFPEHAKNELFCNSNSEPVNIYEVNLLSWKRHKDNSYYTYSQLEKTLVPYVKRMGYTHVEFMPITEFPFDGSWGYQVTGYFSVTARLGTLQEFKSLVDAFHKNSIKVILDWVPAHFPKDEWGLYEFNGSTLYECPLWDRMEHRGWGTRRFDFGRGEVDSFLISSAMFFLDICGVDGLRVDAVASMLYLDYDRKPNDYTPNIYGDNRNLEGIEFLKKLNSAVKNFFPNRLMIAEESTAFPHITTKVENGGLGFDYKWNMGWMNDILFYCKQDPYFRNYHHDKVTFSLVYAFSENFILPLSHDEVVHVKGSIINKMFGEYEDKFSGERALLGFMYAHPGKKLNFMGYEFAQFKEWDYSSGIEFFLKKFALHKKMSCFIKELNFFYLQNKPLFEIEDSWKGFEWLVVDDKANNLVAFNRYSRCGDSITAIVNFSGVDLLKYRIGIAQGSYKIVFDSSSKKFGGNGRIKRRIYNAIKRSSQGKDYSICVDISKLACIYLKKIK